MPNPPPRDPERDALLAELADVFSSRFLADALGMTGAGVRAAAARGRAARRDRGEPRAA